jgi:hypothetical protein
MTTLTVTNNGKCQLLDNDIVKGFALAILDSAGDCRIGIFTDNDGSVTPELYRSSSQARKERDELIREMKYTKDDFIIRPACWEKSKDLVIMFDCLTSKAFKKINLNSKSYQ